MITRYCLSNSLLRCLLTVLFWTISFFFILPTHKILAQSDLGFIKNPRSSFLNQSSLIQKGLSNSCFAIESITDDLPCAASMLSLSDKSFFSAQISLSNGYSSFNLVRGLVNNSIDEEFIDLLLDKKVFQLDTGATLFFRSQYFAGKYVPFSVRAFTALRNEVDPNVELMVIEEKGFYFQTSYPIINETLHIGSQFRILDRKFINAFFKATELASGSQPDLLNAKEESVIFIDPSITYVNKDLMELTFSIGLKNIGSTDNGIENNEEPVDGQAAVSVKYNLSKYGYVIPTIEYNRLNYTEDFVQSIRAGIVYHYGAMQILSGIDYRGLSFGVYSDMKPFTAGIVYTSTRIPNLQSDSFTQAVYMQLGWKSE